MSDVEIIENTQEARAKYGYRYGAQYLEITEKDMAALRDGKTLASNDGEYTTFLGLAKIKGEL